MGLYLDSVFVYRVKEIGLGRRTPQHLPAFIYGGKVKRDYRGLADVMSCKLPVHNLPEGFYILGSGVTIVDVISMLPDITCE